MNSPSAKCLSYAMSRVHRVQGNCGSSIHKCTRVQSTEAEWKYSSQTHKGTEYRVWGTRTWEKTYSPCGFGGRKRKHLFLPITFQHRSFLNIVCKIVSKVLDNTQYDGMMCPIARQWNSLTLFSHKKRGIIRGGIPQYTVSKFLYIKYILKFTKETHKKD